MNDAQQTLIIENVEKCMKSIYKSIAHFCGIFMEPRKERELKDTLLSGRKKCSKRNSFHLKPFYKLMVS